MISFSKLVTAFLLPPGIIILGLLLLIILRRRRTLNLAALGAAVLLYAFSIEPVSDFLLKPLEDKYPPFPRREIENTEVDAIVVLGGGTVAGAPEEGGRDALTGDALKRLSYAARVFLDIQPPRPVFIVTGGRVFDVGQEPEALVASRVLNEFGFPEDALKSESMSRNTWQNAANVKREFSPRRVLLVTSAYHMPRSVWCFRKNGMEVVPAPTDYKTNRGVPYDFISRLPSFGGFENSWKALHEYIGLLSYWVIYR